ncbi:MAG: hypothetical protein M1826_003219 [Phylliscum demangeonii]|nr:MAG: hypothetical protein M1826_003219 [Phylliscum demangeonii]
MLAEKEVVRHAQQRPVVWWTRTLEHRKRTQGFQGVVAFWEEMRRAKVDLPPQGVSAETIWCGFLDAAVQDRSMLTDLLSYFESLVRRRRVIWPAFYEAVIIYLIKGNPAWVLSAHRQLEDWCPRRPGYFARILIALPPRSNSLRIIQQLYEQSSVRDLYPVIIPLLCERGSYEDAYFWHSYLVQNQDLPPTMASAEPLMRYLVRKGRHDAKDVVMRDLLDAGLPRPGPTPSPATAPPALTRESMNKLFAKIFHVPETPPSDAFCARFFATKAFSVDTVVEGMRRLGIQEVGPLTLREMALREESATHVVRRIEQMRTANIGIGSSMFSRLLWRFASENKSQLLHDLLHSDRHPEVLEDPAVEESLLGFHLRRNDARQVQLSLAILTTFGHEPVALQHNLILRHYLSERHLPGIKQVLRDMNDAGIALSPQSADLVAQKRLTNDLGGGSLSLIVDTLARHLLSGGQLDPGIWVAPLRRLGFDGRMAELEQLALRLASIYSKRSDRSLITRSLPARRALETRSSIAPHSATRLPSTVAGHPLDSIFPQSLLRLIIFWAFRAPGGDEWKTRPWTRGLLLVKALADQGVYVHRRIVRQAFLQRLAIVYGIRPARNSADAKLPAYRDVPVQVMLDDACAIWGRDFLTRAPAAAALEVVTASTASPSAPEDAGVDQGGAKGRKTRSPIAPSPRQADYETAVIEKAFQGLALTPVRRPSSPSRRVLGPRPSNVRRPPDPRPDLERTEGNEVVAERDEAIAPAAAGFRGRGIAQVDGCGDATKPLPTTRVLRSAKKPQAAPPPPPPPPPLRPTRPRRSRASNEEDYTFIKPLLRLSTDETVDREAPSDFQAWADELDGLLAVEKIAEASYGEVYRLNGGDQSRDARFGRADEAVLKIIPLKRPPPPTPPRPRRSRRTTRRKIAKAAAAPTSAVDDVLTEARTLVRMTVVPGFTHLLDVRIMRGRLPTQFVSAWHRYLGQVGKTSDFPDPGKKASYPADQLWAVIEMQNAGMDLAQFPLRDGVQMWDVFWSVAVALAKGENLARFEHRDLHLGNICVRERAPRTTARGRSGNLGRSNLEVTIIDYTLSRVDAHDADGDDEETVVFLDLDKDADLFTGSGEYHMRSALYHDNPLQEFDPEVLAQTEDEAQPRRSWRSFQPLTNVLWLHYLLVALADQLATTRSSTAQGQGERCPDDDRGAQYESKLASLRDALHPQRCQSSGCRAATNVVDYALKHGWLDASDVLEYDADDEEMLSSP